MLAAEQLVKFDEEYKPVSPQNGDKNFPRCDLFICQGKDGRCAGSPLKPCECDDKNSKCPDRKANSKAEISIPGFLVRWIVQLTVM